MKKFLSNSKFAGLALGLVALLAITTAAGVNGKFNSVTSALGYQVAGAAGSSGQALCSDGTRYDTPCTIPASGVPRTCSGSYPNESCYHVLGDGTIEAWGHLTVTFPSGTLATGSITYPNTGGNAFTVVPVLTLTPNDNADGDNSFTAWGSSPLTTGTGIKVRCAVNVGGSGCSGSLASTVPIAWRAVQ
jgi:hypothetical protein